MKQIKRAPFSRVALVSNTGCRQSMRLQKAKPDKLYIRKSPAPAAFTHLASNLFTFNSCWLSSSCRTSPGLLCRYLSPDTQRLQRLQNRHSMTNVPSLLFKRIVPSQVLGWLQVLPTGNFHFASRQSTAGKRGGQGSEWRNIDVK